MCMVNPGIDVNRIFWTVWEIWYYVEIEPARLLFLLIIYHFSKNHTLSVADYSMQQGAVWLFLVQIQLHKNYGFCMYNACHLIICTWSPMVCFFVGQIELA